MLKVLGLLDTQLTSQHFLSNATMHLETLPLHCSLAISKTLLMVLRQTVILLAPSPLQARSSPGLIILTFQLLPVLDLYITQHLHHPPTCPLLGLDLLFFLSTSHQCSGSSGGGSIRHTLAASGSGSESKVGGNLSNHAANLSISNHPTNHSNLTLSNHPTTMSTFLTEPPIGPPPLPPGPNNFMIPQSGL